MKKLTLLLIFFCGFLLTSCNKLCEECDCWKGGKIIDSYKHCSGNFTPKKDHKKYREYMIKTYDLDSVTCK